MQYILRLVLLLALFGGLTVPAYAAELISIKNATLVEADFNDGDSFKVNADGRELHLRLYYVDCLETTVRGFLKDRILQQQRHFALKNTGSVLDFGKQATKFTQRVLSMPFTIHTSYAKAPGSATNRYYAFVETSDGDDLGRLLVAQGLARIHGVTRPAPDGMSSENTLAKLGVWRNAAMLKRAGIWSTTDPELLVKSRIEQIGMSESDCPYNLNTATSEQLQKIRHIGPAIAAKIIASRPYRSVQKLLDIPGIGVKKLKAIAPCVTIVGQ